MTLTRDFINRTPPTTTRGDPALIDHPYIENLVQAITVLVAIMYAPVLTLGALLATQTLATDMLAPFPGSGLDKRQGGESFLPDTTPGCPADWPMCGTSGICYDPNRGDICCPGGTCMLWPTFSSTEKDC